MPGVHCVIISSNGELSTNVWHTRTIQIILPSEAEYEFTKNLDDTDAYEKETAQFVCEVNDPDAPVKWFREDKVSWRQCG